MIRLDDSASSPEAGEGAEIVIGVLQAAAVAGFDCDDSRPGPPFVLDFIRSAADAADAHDSSVFTAVANETLGPDADLEKFTLCVEKVLTAVSIE